MFIHHSSKNWVALTRPLRCGLATVCRGDASNDVASIVLLLVTEFPFCQRLNDTRLSYVDRRGGKS